MTGNARGRPARTAPADDADDEARSLAAHEADAWAQPAVAVDIALLTVTDGALHAALIRRDVPPQSGSWALPGGFIRRGESPGDAAGRVLRAKAGLDSVYTAQLATFGAPDRDPRGWIISVAHYALVPADQLRTGLETVDGVVVARVEVPDGTADAGPSVALDGGGELPLAFDHATILARAVTRVRGLLSHAPIAFELMPDEFTLLDLQATYEALLARPIDKNSFRRRVLASGLVAAVGRRREGMRARPAELFRFDRSAVDA